jgi:CMP-N-acetylneuraminic acid synthetase
MGLIRDFVPEPESGRRQDLTPRAYVRNGTVYALKRQALFGSGARLFGHLNSFACVMPPARSVNIDSEENFERCVQLMSQAR